MLEALRVRASGVAGILGGLAWAALPMALATVVGPYLAVVAALLLLFAVAGFYRWHEESFGAAGRVGTSILGMGLSIVVAGAGMAVVGLTGLAVTTGVLAVALLAIGSATLAVGCYRAEVLPFPTVLALGVGVPLSAFVNNTLRLFGVAIGVYGLVWVLIGYHVFAEATEALEDEDA
jgi:hypothetical protein